MTNGNIGLINNSILSGNLAANVATDGRLYIKPSSSNNLIGGLQNPAPLVNGVNGNHVGVSDPMLSALGNFGGPTQTMTPLSGSPAINKGKNSLIPAGVTTDQRGFSRIFGSAVDIGAVEISQLTISGKVFNDIAGNGIPTPGDPGLARWQVYIDLTDAGIYHTGDPIATTAANGDYSLTFSPITVSGPLMVREIRQTNWRGADPGGIYPFNDYLINPAAGNATNINFGNSVTASVTGAVFHDTNANGRLDAGEKGLTGWTIEVDQLVGSVWHNNNFSTKTDAKGNYSIVLIHGTYRIHEVTTGGLHPTKPAAAGYMLTLGTGATQTGENFGND